MVIRPLCANELSFWQTSSRFSVTMEPHCALKTKTHLLKNRSRYHHNANDRFGLNLLKTGVKIQFSPLPPNLASSLWHSAVACWASPKGTGPTHAGGCAKVLPSLTQPPERRKDVSARDASAVGAFALQLVQNDLAHTHALRCHLHVFVFLDVLQRLFEREHHGRDDAGLVV